MLQKNDVPPLFGTNLPLSGAYRETQKWGGARLRGRGRILIKIKSFVKSLTKYSKGGGGEGPSPTPPQYAYVLLHDIDKSAVSHAGAHQLVVPGFKAVSNSFGIVDTL